MARGKGGRASDTRRERGPVAIATSLTVLIWWDVPAASFLFVSAFFFALAVLLEVMVLMSPILAAGLPQVTALTVVLGLLTAYGVWAYREEKRSAREAEALRRVI